MTARRRRPTSPSALLLLLIGLGAGGFSGVAAADAQERSNLVARDQLRVCADPNNLPFSNEKMEGYENKIADVIGQDLKLPVSYVWFPQIIGFVRNTLRAGRCDLVMGTVAGDEIMQTTTPYYYTSYVAIYRKDKPIDISDFADAKLKPLHFGVVSGTPPADLLVKYGLMANARPYQLTVDTRYDAPGRDMVNDVASGAIDAGLLWGPIAGFYIQHEHLPLDVTVLKSQPGLPRMAYHIAMGLRANEPDWRRRINSAIHDKQSEITAILREYGVPLLDEQGNPLTP